MSYAVVVCRSCRTPWAVETRHARGTCPRCRTENDLKRRRRLWQGPDARDAQEAAGRASAALAQGLDPSQATLPVTPGPARRHDDDVAAAAAHGRSRRGTSARAEAVAVHLAQVRGEVAHDDCVAALVASGLSAQRAEKELVRLLATDVLYEPRAGRYSALA